MRHTTELQFNNGTDQLVGLGVLGEVEGLVVMPLGGNTVGVQGDLAVLSADQRDQLDKLVRVPLDAEAAAGSPPVAGEGTQGQAVTWVGELPPRSGAGATRDAWAAFAEANKVPFPADASRDDIIERVEAHRGS
jgi:hypothetical protein